MADEPHGANAAPSREHSKFPSGRGCTTVSWANDACVSSVVSGGVAVNATPTGSSGAPSRATANSQ